MGKREKQIQRLKGMPKDFTFIELNSLLESLGFVLLNKGKTSGSRIKYMKGRIGIYLHKPHRRKELLEYQVKHILEVLEKEGIV